MAENTKIEWARHTWNPWIGCTKVSPACDHCYAEALMDIRHGRVTWGAGQDRSRTSPSNWKEPLRWDRAAAEAGEKATVFCLSLGDIWDNEVDPMWRRQAFEVMEATPNLIYLLLSKRIGNAIKMTDPRAGNPPLPRNAALGATMINQAEWDRDVPALCRAAEYLGPMFTFASVEPMLGPITMTGVVPDWVICGGESGAGARPRHPDWARGLRDQCAEAGIPYFDKQHGDWLPWEPGTAPYWVSQNGQEVDHHALFPTNLVDDPPGWDSGMSYVANGEGHAVFQRVGKKRAGRLLDGVEHNGMPEVIDG